MCGDCGPRCTLVGTVAHLSLLSPLTCDLSVSPPCHCLSLTHSPPTAGLEMSSPSQPWPTPPVIDAKYKSQLILLECRPRAALLALRRIDDPCFYPFRVRHLELKHDRLSRELQEAQSAASKRRLRAVVDMAVVGLQKARDRQARFTADPQRFIEERRSELAKEIAELHDELATLRRSVGLPPLPFPLERVTDQQQPPSPPTPTVSQTTTVTASSLHKRRPLSDTS